MGNNCCCCGSSQKHKSGPTASAQQTQTPQRPHTNHASVTNLQQHPQTVVSAHNPKIVVAVYPYEARDSEDLSFDKGDRMEIQDDSDHDWLFVQHLITGNKGYIPANFVASESSMESEDWFFENTSRKEAEKLLLGDATQSRGTFLIRPSEHNPGGYSLSIIDWNMDKGYLVKHYKIETKDTGEYFIYSRNPFKSLAELVAAYSKKNASGLCYTLTKSCRKPEPIMRDLAHAYRDQWDIPRDEIQLVRRLGKGNFGEVWYGKWKNQFDVAVKTLKKDAMSTEAFLQEGAIMKKFRHKRLVQLYGICSEGEPIYIITEYMANGSLLDYLRKDQGQTLKFDDLIFIAYQVASGMAHLESLNFIHRDLAARNVLLGEFNVVKICDFGLTRLVETDKVYTAVTLNLKFAVKWTAPEALYTNEFSNKSDVWSYGIFLTELFTFGQTPYEGIPLSEVYGLVSSGYRMPKPRDLPTEIYEIMEKCWHEQPNKRPAFKILEYYFETIDVKYNDQSQISQQPVLTRNKPHCYEEHNNFKNIN